MPPGKSAANTLRNSNIASTIFLSAFAMKFYLCKKNLVLICSKNYNFISPNIVTMHSCDFLVYIGLKMWSDYEV